MYYIDNLRTTLIAYLIIEHLICIYSGVGWELMPDVQRFGRAASDAFGFILMFQESYFLGVLFFIAGYFVVGSYERKGVFWFAKDRLLRLGLPALLTMLLISPITNGLLFGDVWYNPSLGFWAQINLLLNRVGVMWFAEALLVFSLVYGIAQSRLSQKRIDSVKSLDAAGSIEPTPHSAGMAFTLRCEFGLILCIAVFAFLIRIWFSSTRIVFGIRPGNFSSYIFLFVGGILARKGHLLAKLTYRHGLVWLAAGLFLGGGGGVALFILGGGTEAFNVFGVRISGIEAFQGGLTWQSAAYTLWESFVAISMTVGLLALFKEKFNRGTRMSCALSADAFAVYMFHLPVVMAVATLAEPLPPPPIVKFVLLCVICVPLCFALAHYVFRRIPVLGRLL
jgi:hypothetical protein